MGHFDRIVTDPRRTAVAWISLKSVQRLGGWLSAECRRHPVSGRMAQYPQSVPRLSVPSAQPADQECGLQCRGLPPPARSLHGEGRAVSAGASTISRSVRRTPHSPARWGTGHGQVSARVQQRAWSTLLADRPSARPASQSWPGWVPTLHLPPRMRFVEGAAAPLTSPVAPPVPPPSAAGRMESAP